MKKRAKQTPTAAGNPPLLLRLPAEIGMPLLADSVKSGESIQTLILQIVAGHYRVKLPSRVGGRPRKPAAE